MQHTVLTVLQVILIMVLFLWLISLAVSLVLQQHQAFLRWSGRSLQAAWRRAWQFILGVIIGYWLLGAPLIQVT